MAATSCYVNMTFFTPNQSKQILATKTDNPNVMRHLFCMEKYFLTPTHAFYIRDLLIYPIVVAKANPWELDSQDDKMSADLEDKKVEASLSNEEKEPAEDGKAPLHNETRAEWRARMVSIALANTASCILAIGFTIIMPGMYQYMKQVS